MMQLWIKTVLPTVISMHIVINVTVFFGFLLTTCDNLGFCLRTCDIFAFVQLNSNQDATFSLCLRRFLAI